MSRLLLGSDFMFNEELGSRLRGIGHEVSVFSNLQDLEAMLKFNFDLVIIDLEQQSLGGLASLNSIIRKKHKVLAITEHRSADLASKALEMGASKVIYNSQASKNIEMFVETLLN